MPYYCLGAVGPSGGLIMLSAETGSTTFELLSKSDQ